MREDLLGYLLGALEPEEMQRVGRAVRDNPALAAELDRLQAALRPLEQAEEFADPPPDLVSRTLGAIDRYEAEHETQRGASVTAGNRLRGGRPLGTAAGIAPTAGQLRLADCLATAVAALIMAGLVLPSVLRGRSFARQESCQNLLREMGVSVVQYALRDQDGRIPQVPLEGRQSFAGNYALLLNEQGLMPRSSFLWCPSRDVPEEWYGRPIPDVEELHSADPQQLESIHQVAGGHYAYSLGVHERGCFVAPRYQGRSAFAILADAPTELLTGWATAHEGRGVNLLFEDGRVQFVAHRAMDALFDHPFLNRKGDVEAGLDPHDATLGSSWRPPFQIKVTADRR